MKNNNDILISYLTYVNEKNKSYRLSHFNESIESFSEILKEYDGISVDNNSLEKVRDKLLEFNFLKCFHFSENFFDIALFFVGIWEAKRLNKNYVLFAYDDFICSENASNVLKSTKEFMDKNPDVGCTRITAYSLENQKLFDSNFTPKSKNPDSVRHYNTVSNKPLQWSESVSVGNNKFKKTNWHYTSRPTCWRVSVLEKMIESLEEIPILQGFEQFAASKFESMNLLTGVLDIGMMKTTPITDSARTNELKLDVEMNIRISKNKLYKAYENALKGVK